MTIKTAMTALLRWARHCLSAMRSLSPAAVIAVTIALLVGGAGFADAATGGTFILGKANTERATASLTDSKGTPLSLSAPANVAPLAVSGATMVPNLNANYLGGLSASALQPTGGDGFTPYNTSIPLPFGSNTLVASTGALPAGTYYVTATALMQLSSGGQGTCFITTGSNPTVILATGGGSGTQQQAAETVAASVTAGDTLQELCDTNNSNGAAVSLYAGITAIRILSSSTSAPLAGG